MGHAHTGQRRFQVLAELDGDDIHLHTDLRKADACTHEPILRALAQHLGFDTVPMQKAYRDKRPDPRYPELSRLIRDARRNWDAWGPRLVQEVQELLDGGRLLPMSASTQSALEELFRDNVVRLQLSFAGFAPDLKRTGRLVSQGLVDPERAHVPVAFRLGRGLRALELQRVNPDAAPPLEELLEEALTVELTRQDEEALSYARKRAALYVRKPAEHVRSELGRVLNDFDVGAMRHVISDAVAARATPDELERDLRSAMAGTVVQTNNMERIARTELAFAHSFGAYRALKADAEAAGIIDPEVFKFVSPGACEDCRRIWGPPADPIRYLLSFVERREAAGGNFGLPRSQWGPVVGPVHPNCFPAGVRVTTERGDLPIERVVVGDRVWTHRGRWRRVYSTMSRRSDTVRLQGIPVTPEHPFLTLNGWRPAGQIEPGEYLLEPTEVGLANANDLPAQCTQSSCLSAVLLLLLLGGVPVAPVDFNGDLHRHQREVHKEALHLVARCRDDAASPELVEESLLQLRLHAPSLGLDHPPHHLLGLRGAANGIVRRSDVLLALLGGHAAMPNHSSLDSRAGATPSLQPLSHRAAITSLVPSDLRDADSTVERSDSGVHVDLRSPASIRPTAGDPRGVQPDVDHLHGAPELPRNTRSREPRLVKVDDHARRDVVSAIHAGPHRTVVVDRYPVRDRAAVPVFNLSVEQYESYIAEGRIVHNCTEGPLQYYEAGLVDAINEAADELSAIFGD